MPIRKCGWHEKRAGGVGYEAWQHLFFLIFLLLFSSRKKVRLIKPLASAKIIFFKGIVLSCLDACPTGVSRAGKKE